MQIVVPRGGLHGLQKHIACYSRGRVGQRGELVFRQQNFSPKNYANQIMNIISLTTSSIHTLYYDCIICRIWRATPDLRHCDYVYYLALGAKKKTTVTKDTLDLSIFPEQLDILKQQARIKYWRYSYTLHEIWRLHNSTCTVKSFLGEERTTAELQLNSFFSLIQLLSQIPSLLSIYFLSLSS